METKTNPKVKWTSFEIEREDREGTTFSSVHGFIPKESKHWIYSEYKRLGYTGLYEGNKSLCGKFQLFNENERVEEFVNLEGCTLEELPQYLKVCGNCLKSYHKAIKTT